MREDSRSWKDGPLLEVHFVDKQNWVSTQSVVSHHGRDSRCRGCRYTPPPKYTPGNKIEIGATSTHGCDQTPPLKSIAVQILGLIFKRDEQQPLMIDRTVLDVETPGQTEEETQPCLCQLYEMSVNKYILLVCCALILFRELSTYTYHKCVGTLPQQP